MYIYRRAPPTISLIEYARLWCCPCTVYRYIRNDDGKPNVVPMKPMKPIEGGKASLGLRLGGGGNYSENEIREINSRPVNGKTGTESGKKTKKIRVRIIRCERGGVDNFSTGSDLFCFSFFFFSIIGRIIFKRGMKQCISYTGSNYQRTIFYATSCVRE